MMKREEWGSSLSFILAATGAAVGLGNIWKFPYIVGENGGGSFVLVYVVCIMLIGFPLLVTEIFIGRRGRQNPALAYFNLAYEVNASGLWRYLGVLVIITSFLILSYYSVIAGWSIEYLYDSLSGKVLLSNPKKIEQTFSEFTNSFQRLSFLHTWVMLLTTIVVSLGIKQGIERTVKWMFPMMLVLLLIVCIYSMDTGYFKRGVQFMFYPNFHKISSNAILVALGHAFFTLSLATGSIMMYGAYLPRRKHITQVALMIVLADTCIALLAGLAIFPIVFAHQLTPSRGPGLIFITLPIAFSKMYGGTILSAAFFMMLFLAGFTSCISVLEPSVCYLIERHQYTRRSAAMTCGFSIWLLGLATAASFNLLKDYTFHGANFFEWLDYMTANVFLPLSGLLTSLFIGWRYSHLLFCEELDRRPQSLVALWLRLSLRFVAPMGIIGIFLRAIGFI